jgi:hypothetical protein
MSREAQKQRLLGKLARGIAYTGPVFAIVVGATAFNVAAAETTLDTHYLMVAAGEAEAEGEAKSHGEGEAEGKAEEIRAIATATAGSIEQIAGAINVKGGTAAFKLKLSERYIDVFKSLENSKIILPANVAEYRSWVDNLGLEKAITDKTPEIDE